MEKEYRYFRYRNGQIARIHLEQDIEPIDPRYDWDGNIGKMMCWSRGYNLGDYKENDYNTPEEFLNDLVREKIEDKTIINFIKAKKTSNGLELKYNRKEEIWELWGYWKVWWNGNKVHHGVIESNNPIEHLIDDMIEAMSFEDKWKLLERHAHIVFLPLYLYDHSGLSMNCGGFSDSWDSGQCGYIYTDRETILKDGISIINDKGNYIKVTKRNWKECAYKIMEGEIEIYDCYLSDDCYGYIVDELDMDDQSSLESEMNILEEEDMNWNEDTDSCWGFLTDKWGDELFEEIVSNGLGDFKLYENLNDLLEDKIA